MSELGKDQCARRYPVASRGHLSSSQRFDVGSYIANVGAGERPGKKLGHRRARIHNPLLSLLHILARLFSF